VRDQAKRPDDQLGRPLSAAAPDEGTQSSNQFCKRKRFCQVVVCPDIQPGDPVVDAVARGQHEDGRPHARIPKLPAGLEAGQPGEHDVEHDRLVRMCLCHPHRVLARDGDVGRVSLLDQTPVEETGHLQFVLDDQDAHPGSLPAGGENQMRRRAANPRRRQARACRR
jgi:hypothetical protein